MFNIFYAFKLHVMLSVGETMKVKCTGLYLVKKVSALSELWPKRVLTPVNSELSGESLLKKCTVISSPSSCCKISHMCTVCALQVVI